MSAKGKKHLGKKPPKGVALRPGGALVVRVPADSDEALISRTAERASRGLPYGTSVTVVAAEAIEVSEREWAVRHENGLTGQPFATRIQAGVQRAYLDAACACSQPHVLLRRDTLPWQQEDEATPADVLARMDSSPLPEDEVRVLLPPDLIAIRNVTRLADVLTRQLGRRISVGFGDRPGPFEVPPGESEGAK